MAAKWVIFAAGAPLLAVNMIDGRVVQINPAQVTRMSEARRDIAEDKQLAEGVNCVIFFTDGSYLSVANHCTDIVNRWMDVRKPEEP